MQPWVKTLVIGGLLALGMIGMPVQSAPAQPLLPTDFVEVAPQGLGDRQNSAAWSMQWWNGKLYVGTVRSWFCWVQLWAHMNITRLVPYPPRDPDKECAPDPRDLPLQAEIWRYTPETDTWERVYQAPRNVEIPGHPGKFTARDIGYRGMTVFKEADGTEALYVGGATVNAIWPPMPPPRILRSTDGVHFEPIPQEPGTLLGDLGNRQATFRDFEVYKGRLYLMNGDIQGHGGVLEAENPAGGNDNFRWITPPGMRVFEMAVYNGYLYLGLADRYGGYGVVKTDATGEPPYTFTPVVTQGAYLEPLPSISVVSMTEANGRLYVGTDQPTEIIRINPDDSWDLIVGTPRETPTGWKFPLSGLGAGFDWALNAHMWRMQEHEGVLYVGTNDQGTMLRGRNPEVDALLNWQYGFDLYASPDGYYFTPLTVNGLGDKFQVGVRSFASTPAGLFMGSVSYWYGMRIWRAGPGQESAVQVVPPQRVEAERMDGGIVVSWDQPPGVTRFHVYRADPVRGAALQPASPAFEFGTPTLDPSAWFFGAFQEVGTTDQFYFVDTTALADRPYLYRVVAEDEGGLLSHPSNVARGPSLAPAVTIPYLQQALDAWLGGRDSAQEGPRASSAFDALPQTRPVAGLGNAVWHLQQFSWRIQEGRRTQPDAWRAEDFTIQLARLARRVRLVQAGVLDPVVLYEWRQ